MWGRLGAELGVLGLSVPEADGGVGGTLVDQAVAVEELGASLACGPVFGTVFLAIPALVAASPGPVRDELLAELVEGSRTAAFAVADRAGAFDPAAVTVTRRNPAPSPERSSGSSTAARPTTCWSRPPVPTASPCTPSTRPGPASQRNPLVTLDLTRPQATIRFSDAPARLVAGPGEAERVIEHALQVGSALLAAEQVGAAQHLLDLSVDYAKSAAAVRQADRLVPGGQAQAGGPARRRRARPLHGVPRGVGADGRLGRPGAGGEHRAGRRSAAFSRIAPDTIQVHGGIGFTWEHQAHLYFKRATTDAALLGSAEQHRSRVAELVLDNAVADRAPWVATALPPDAELTSGRVPPLCLTSVRDNRLTSRGATGGGDGTSCPARRSPGWGTAGAGSAG